MVVAIPNFGKRVSPRLDYAESLQLITIKDKTIIKKETIKLIVHSNLERINLIIHLHPDLIICDGISELSSDKIMGSKIKIISWVNGTIDDILGKYLDGKLNESKNNKLNV